MIKPDITPDEVERLKDLDSYHILDTLPEKEYDDITKIASRLCGTSISLISLIDEKRQWFKSHHGIDATETPREYAFCAHAIHDKNSVFVVPDSRKDERFHDNPLVTEDPFVIFYVGVPLVSPSGFSLGTLCVIDHEPGELNAEQVDSLQALANHVVKLLELRKAKKELLLHVKDLEEKNSAMESFALVAAHDIKSPLASISSLLGLLKEDYDVAFGEEGKKLISLVNNSATDLRNLVDGILQHSRSEKLIDNDKEVVLMTDFFEGVINLIDPAKLHHFIKPTLVSKALINKVALQQVLMNLISNSIRYNDKKKVLIQLDFRELDKFYHFEVIDNGCGIESRYMDRIFGMFETFHPSTESRAKGSGVGLATVKKIVEALGGEISFTTEVGKGTKFEFTILK